MPQSVYKVIEVIGTSPKSWEEAAKNAVELTGEHLRELRVAEVMAQDRRHQRRRQGRGLPHQAQQSRSNMRAATDGPEARLP